ncbi:MAG: hypothetical protein AAF074_15330, partial [Pseudomonadota bacterium]
MPDAEASVRAYIAGAWPVLERLGLAAGADPEAVQLAPITPAPRMAMGRGVAVASVIRTVPVGGGRRR